MSMLHYVGRTPRSARDALVPLPRTCMTPNNGDSLAPSPVVMREKTLTIPEIVLIGGTRVALGAGIGLLLSGKLNKDERRGAGFALLGIGILTTFPIVMGILAKSRPAEKPSLTLAS